MISKKLLFFLLLSSLAFSTMDARRKHAKNPICENQEECEDPNSTCQCYCSRMCGFRERETDDQPVWVRHNGPNGRPGCFCKPWDRDAYNERCARSQMEEEVE